MKIKNKEYVYYLCDCLGSQMFFDHFITVLLDKKMKPSYMIIKQRIWDKRALLFGKLQLDVFVFKKRDIIDIGNGISPHAKGGTIMFKEARGASFPIALSFIKRVGKIPLCQKWIFPVP